MHDAMCPCEDFASLAAPVVCCRDVRARTHIWFKSMAYVPVPDSPALTPACPTCRSSDLQTARVSAHTQESV